MRGAPDQIGPYRVVAEIGRGGMGAVYRAIHPAGREVAVKVLLARGASEARRQRFQREVQALQRLRSEPGIVEVLDAGSSEGLPFLVMDLVPGESLEARLRRTGTLAVFDVLELGHQLCVAMSAAHAQGILHRDMKPDNVLCAPDGTYVITDFGLAKELEVEASIELSRTGIPQGTPGYWAPEQALGGAKDATTATDVYGIGATLYAALTGRAVFEADSFIGVLAKTKEDPPTPPSELRPDVPPALEAVILCCLAKDPGDRYSSAAELGDALERLDQPARSSRGWVLLGVGIMVIGALVGGGAWIWQRAWATERDRAHFEDLWAQERFADTRTLAQRFAEEGEPKAMARLGHLYQHGLGGPADEASARTWYLRSAEAGNADAMFALARFLQKREPTEALRWFRSASEAGAPIAQRTFALRLLEGFAGQKDESEAVRLLRLASEGGDLRAKTQLGLCLSTGRGVPADPLQARRLLREAAEAHDLAGMYRLAHALQSGLGGERDRAGALRWFRQAAEGGHARAMADLAMSLTHKEASAEELAEALKWNRGAADAGELDAMRNLGLMHKRGHGVPQDFAAAARWFRKGAEAGSAHSMRSLGGAYFDGQGVERDPVEGLRWLERAGEGGVVEALVDLADRFRLGQGVTRDEAMSLSFTRRAAKAGDALSMGNMGAVHERGLLGAKKDMTLAVSWYRRSAEAGRSQSMHRLAMLLERGQGVPRDEEAAMAWYRRSMAAGQADSANALGAMLLARGGPAELEEATRLLRGAADQGNLQALRNLGVCYEKGQGVGQDFVRAVDCYRRAGEGGMPLAMVSLGRMFLKGRGVETNHRRAKEWFEKAARAGNAVGMLEAGVLLAQGKSVPRDDTAARRWFSAGAKKKDAECAYNLAAMTLAGRGGRKDRAQGYAWIQRSASWGYPRAALDVARANESGHFGQPKNLAAAKHWFQRATRSKDAEVRAEAARGLRRVQR
jgi:TPR repeat protein/predicted Ser/Thr protein kinase